MALLTFDSKKSDNNCYFEDHIISDHHPLILSILGLHIFSFNLGNANYKKYICKNSIKSFFIFNKIYNYDIICLQEVDIKSDIFNFLCNLLNTYKITFIKIGVNNYNVTLFKDYNDLFTIKSIDTINITDHIKKRFLVTEYYIFDYFYNFKNNITVYNCKFPTYPFNRNYKEKIDTWNICIAIAQEMVKNIEKILINSYNSQLIIIAGDFNINNKNLNDIHTILKERNIKFTNYLDILLILRKKYDNSSINLELGWNDLIFTISYNPT